MKQRFLKRFFTLGVLMLAFLLVTVRVVYPLTMDTISLVRLNGEITEYERAYTQFGDSTPEGAELYQQKADICNSSLLINLYDQAGGAQILFVFALICWYLVPVYMVEMLQRQRNCNKRRHYNYCSRGNLY